MINNVVLVSGVQQSDSVIHIHVSILFQILFPFRLLENIEQSSLCYSVGPCWLSVLNPVVCTLLLFLPPFTTLWYMVVVKFTISQVARYQNRVTKAQRTTKQDPGNTHSGSLHSLTRYGLFSCREKADLSLFVQGCVDV